MVPAPNPVFRRASDGAVLGAPTVAWAPPPPVVAQPERRTVGLGVADGVALGHAVDVDRSAVGVAVPRFAGPDRDAGGHQADRGTGEADRDTGRQADRDSSRGETVGDSIAGAKPTATAPAAKPTATAAAKPSATPGSRP